MIFHRPALVQWLFVVCATMGMALPSPAQRGSQPIIFSAPDAALGTNFAPSLVPQKGQTPELMEGIQIPSISTPPSLQPPPVPVRIMTRAQITAAQQQMDRDKNWTLLTPAEILGVPTPENTLGVSGRDAAGGKKDQTALERYFDRQQNIEQSAMTNPSPAFNSLPDWNLPNRTWTDLNSGFAGTRNGSVLNSGQDNSLNVNQNNNAIWPGSTASQNISPLARTPEQMAAAQAAAAEFQKLLQPGLTASTEKALQSSTVPTAPNFLPVQPVASSVGKSFAPVSSGIVMPQGMPALPNAITDKNPSTTPVTPVWKRKLSPWMSGPAANQPF